MEPNAVNSFRDFFKQATGLEQDPYPYQERLASERVESRLIHVPTALGKVPVSSWLGYAARRVRVAGRAGRAARPVGRGRDTVTSPGVGPSGRRLYESKGPRSLERGRRSSAWKPLLSKQPFNAAMRVTRGCDCTIGNTVSAREGLRFFGGLVARCFESSMFHEPARNFGLDISRSFTHSGL